VIATIATSAGTQFGVTVTPDGGRIYVSNFAAGTVVVIDTVTNTIIATVVVGSGPRHLNITPDGSRIYVPNFSSSTVSVISTATNAVIATVPVGSSPVGISLSPNGASAYVANSTSNTVSHISTATNTVTATIPVGAGPSAVGMFIRPPARALDVADVDGNGVTDALTDGLLLLRYAFGIRGTALTAGAIGPGATRITPAAIEEYLLKPVVP